MMRSTTWLSMLALSEGMMVTAESVTVNGYPTASPPPKKGSLR